MPKILTQAQLDHPNLVRAEFAGQEGNTQDLRAFLGLNKRASVVEALLLGVSLVVNLGVLCYFKYANFFLQSLAEALHAMGASASLPLLKVILPIGISFYTFEAISYVVDVYKGRLRAERSRCRWRSYRLRFPHGPLDGPVYQR